MLKLLDLFSGIGGFSLGMEATKRISTVAFCEKDEYCRKVLKKHWSNTQRYIDIRDIDGTKISADIISGGFPCQSFSVAGKRKGTEDNRYLWPQMLRVITEVKPRWVIGENVQGIININNGLVLRQVQTDLEAQGFQVQCFLIPASGIGAWHKRNRVWILGYSEHNGSSTAKIKGGNFETAARSSQGEKATRKFKRTGRSLYNEYVPNSNLSRSLKKYSSSINRRDKRDGSINESSSGSNKNVSNSNSRLRRRRGTIKESGTNEIWGFYPTQEEQTEQHIRSKAIGCDAISEQAKSWWQTQSSLFGVPHGISYELDKDRANRIKSLGNSIIPQIAYQIGKAIIYAEDDV
tara:strand:+ start:169 stop:1215 length:1047 start_codon:yes stop_codon:yes gene_type:complete